MEIFKNLSAYGLAAALMMGSLPVASAADYLDGGSRCIPLDPAKLLSIGNNADLTNRVVDMMNEAVSVAEDEAVINNSRAAYTWASEAKIACGKAYGYLRSDYRDEQYLNRCECYFRRMQHFLY